MAIVLITVPHGHDLAFEELARFSKRFEGSRSHRLAVKAGERTLTLAESWNVEPSAEFFSQLRRIGVEPEVVDG
jgi:hypothetical protein